MPATLAVVPASAAQLGSEVVPTAGSWERSGEDARFTPRFAPVGGTEFVVLGREQDAWRELARFRIPESGGQPTTVVQSIDPSTESVPANLLRFAVTFSSTMEDGSAAGHIRLLDGSGAVIPGALLDMPPELWDRDRRRLTVLLEPGRIKRGLQPNLLAGAPLREGETVTLEVDAGIRDVHGHPLVEPARRTYRVGPAIRSRIDPHRWALRWPDADDDRLTIRFDRPLDRALVRRYVRVIDGGGEIVEGETALDKDASLWTFAPTPGRAELRVRVDARLEDLAGNSVRRVFDRDLENAVDDSIDDTEIVLSRPRD